MVTFQGCKVINKNLQIELQSDVFLWNPEKTRKLFYIINNIFGPPVWLRALWLPLCPFFDGHGLPPGAPDTGLLAGHKERKAGVTLDSLGRAFNSPAWETSVDKPARLIIILCWFQMPRQWTKCECMWLCTAMTSNRMCQADFPASPTWRWYGSVWALERMSVWLERRDDSHWSRRHMGAVQLPAPNIISPPHLPPFQQHFEQYGFQLLISSCTTCIGSMAPAYLQL